ncbi:MAG: ATP-binding protein [Actinomycetota bacterium]
MLDARTTLGEHRPVTRAVALFVVLSVVPLTLLTWFAVHRSTAVLRQQGAESLHRTAAVTALAVDKEMQGLLEVVTSYARLPSMVSAIGQHRIDRRTLRFELGELLNARSGIATVFVADASGTLLDILPETTSIVGHDFSYRDWYKGVVKIDTPYVSEAYESLAAGHPRVVAAAVPIHGRDGRLKGILVAAYSLGTIQDFVENFGASQGVEIDVTDQRGVLVAAPDISLRDLVSRASDPAVRNALHGSTGTLRQSVDGEDVETGYAPVAPLGWTVTARVPERVLVAPGAQVRNAVYALAAVLFVLLLTGVFALARSLTARARAEHAAERARAEAETANQAKSEFLSRMSHELRTPLNAMLGFGQLLEMEELTGEQRESVDQIVKAGRHLLGLINEVLDIARIEAGRLSLSLEPVQMRETLEECADLTRPLAERNGVTLAVDVADPQPLAIADRQRLQQVFLNLISNAIKYNHAGGNVSLVCRELDDRVEVSVTDTGPGIPADRLANLFTPFDRLGAEASGIEGTGLGLALTQSLVEAMRGSIAVRSEVGTGTTFTVRLPVAAAGAALATGEDAVAGFETRTGRPATVLYIEDNASNVRLLQSVLNHRPQVRLVTSGSGRAGLELAFDLVPDVVLLDLHLPDMTGDEILHALKEDERTSSIPVIVMSADATSGRSRRIIAAGAREFITKPIDVRRFLDVLDAELDDGSERREEVRA